MIANILMSKLLGPLIRHGMAAAGAWAVAEGHMDADQVQQMTGGALVAASVAISYVEKAIRN